MWRKSSCRGDWGLVNDYADGRLVGRRRAAAERHLADCARCRELLRDLGVVRRRVADTAVARPSEGFWDRCMEVIAARAWQSRSPRPHWRWAAGVALAVAVVLFFWLGPMRRMLRPESGLVGKTYAGIPESEYLAQHAAFAAAGSLGTASHHVLLTALSDEKRSAESAARSLPRDWTHDADAEVYW
jgi:anti-sigma factor RsiW